MYAKYSVSVLFINMRTSYHLMLVPLAEAKVEQRETPSCLAKEILHKELYKLLGNSSGVARPMKLPGHLLGTKHPEKFHTC